HAYWVLPQAGDLTAQQVREALNRLPGVADLPNGRLVQLRFENSGAAMEFQKLGREFLQTRRPTGRTPVPPDKTPAHAPEGSRTPSLADTHRDMRAVVEHMEAITRRDSRPHAVEGSRRITLVPGAP